MHVGRCEGLMKVDGSIFVVTLTDGFYYARFLYRVSEDGDNKPVSEASL
jgi:hypothetical protein